MTVFNAVKQNRKALSGLLEHRKIMDSKSACCWTCQQDKSTLGGHMRLAPGLHLFVCKDCMDAKRLRKAQAANTTGEKS